MIPRLEVALFLVLEDGVHCDLEDVENQEWAAALSQEKSRRRLFRFLKLIAGDLPAILLVAIPFEDLGCAFNARNSQSSTDYGFLMADLMLDIRLFVSFVN